MNPLLQMLVHVHVPCKQFCRRFQRVEVNCNQLQKSTKHVEFSTLHRAKVEDGIPCNCGRCRHGAMHVDTIYSGYLYTFAKMLGKVGNSAIFSQQGGLNKLGLKVSLKFVEQLQTSGKELMVIDTILARPLLVLLKINSSLYICWKSHKQLRADVVSLTTQRRQKSSFLQYRIVP